MIDQFSLGFLLDRMHLCVYTNVLRDTHSVCLTPRHGRTLHTVMQAHAHRKQHIVANMFGLYISDNILYICEHYP